MGLSVYIVAHDTNKCFCLTMAWSSIYVGNRIEVVQGDVFVYSSNSTSSMSSRISVGNAISAFWSGSDVIVVLSNGQRRRYSSSSSWSTVY